MKMKTATTTPPPTGSTTATSGASFAGPAGPATPPTSSIVDKATIITASTSTTDLVSASSVSSAASSSAEEEEQGGVSVSVSPAPSHDLLQADDEEEDKWHLEWDNNNHSNSTGGMKAKALAAAAPTDDDDDDDDEASTSTTSTTATPTPTAVVAAVATTATSASSAAAAAVTVVRLLRSNNNKGNNKVFDSLKDQHLIVMDSKLYDVSQVMGWHPGGKEVIDFYCVRDRAASAAAASADDETNLLRLTQVIDATDAFRGYHPTYVDKMLSAYHVGDVVVSSSVVVQEDKKDKQQQPSSSSPAAADNDVEAAFLQDYRALTNQFESEGLFEINTTYFHQVLGRCFVMLGVAVYFTTQQGKLYQQLLVGAPLLGLFIQQILLLGHDAGHNGITHCRSKDKWYGWLFGPVLTGISMVWWKYNHNIHHVMTNSVEHDVDLTDVMPVFATQTNIYESHWKKNGGSASASSDGGGEQGDGASATQAAASTTAAAAATTTTTNKKTDEAVVTVTSATAAATSSNPSSSTPVKKLDRLAQLDFLSEKLSRFLVKYQHLTFFPIMFFYARINLHFKGYGYTLGQLCEVLSSSSSQSASTSAEPLSPKSRQYRNERLQDVVMDMIGCLTYWFWMTQLVSRNLDGVLAKVAFVLVVHAAAGLIHIQICINHFPMPAFKHLAEEEQEGQADGKTTAGTSTDDDSIDPTCWPAMHLNGTMDVDCPPYMDWFHGGLQFQVEHHLWPRIPRHNLRKIKQRTIDLCGRHLTSNGQPVVKYEAMPLMKAVVYLYKHMEEVAEQVQQLPTEGGEGGGDDNNKVPNFYDSITYKAACLDG